MFALAGPPAPGRWLACFAGRGVASNAGTVSLEADRWLAAAVERTGGAEERTLASEERAGLSCGRASAARAVSGRKLK